MISVLSNVLLPINLSFMFTVGIMDVVSIYGKTSATVKRPSKRTTCADRWPVRMISWSSSNCVLRTRYAIFERMSVRSVTAARYPTVHGPSGSWQQRRLSGLPRSHISLSKSCQCSATSSWLSLSADRCAVKRTNNKALATMLFRCVHKV